MRLFCVLSIIIDRCADCDALDDGTVTEDEESALCILVHILGECGEPKLFAPLLRLLAGDRDKIDQLFGDMLTETVDKILISIFDGRPAVFALPHEQPASQRFLSRCSVQRLDLSGGEGGLAD